jgi:serine/threonine protein kinase
MADGFLTEHVPVPGYEVVRCLGRNGAIVYLARQLSSGKQVALKVYDHGFAESVQRDEATLARLAHPNILRVFEIGEVEGRVYTAVEYVRRTLADRLREGPLSAPQAAALTRTIALTLEYARDQGMTHLNLTPALILLTDEGAPKLFDFQQTEVVEHWDEQESVAMMGPPAYLAPEDLRRGRHGVSPMADVYRVGAAMYTMLTGQPPFAGDLGEIVRAVLERPPKRPRELSSAVSTAIEAVCMKCLEKRPERRYASLQELADDLGRLMKTG